MTLRPYALAALLGLSLFAGAATAKTVTLVGQNDLRYSQERITAAPGESVTIKLVNKSRLPASAMAHNWVLLKPGTNADAFDNAAQNAAANDYFPKSRADAVIAHTGLVAGGESKSVTFTAPKKPGTYEYICTFPGHFAAGMKGVLVVKSG